MDKIQITVLDFMPAYGKFPTGIKDTEGVMLCYGDAVMDSGGEKHLVAYRYGETVLKQPHTAHYISLKENQVTKLNEVWSALDFLIIGHVDEPFILTIPDDIERTTKPGFK